jgi:hypothetical protein
MSVAAVIVLSFATARAGAALWASRPDPATSCSAT